MWPELVDAASLLTDTERKIVKAVIDRCLNLKESTLQRSLEARFRDPDAVSRLSRYGVIAAATGPGYFPTALGIELCGDPNQISVARGAVEFVLQVLRKLFELETAKESFDFSEIESEARKISHDVPIDTLRLGIYIATEFPVFNSYGGTELQIDRVGISNRILKIKNIDSEWDRHVRDRMVLLENARTPERSGMFLTNLASLEPGASPGLRRSVAEQVAINSGFQYDEIGWLFERLEADGLVAIDPISDALVLKDAGLARVRATAGQSVRFNAEREMNPRAVFLVHGHNEEVKQTVARFLEKLGLEAIILHERPNEGKTLIEKIEKNSNVGFAVVLLTPDDQGGPALDPGKARPRARQNVILELGYFIGRLGRSRVCPMLAEGVERPSDVHDLVYVPYDAPGAWRLTLAREIRAAGIAVDLNLIA